MKNLKLYFITLFSILFCYYLAIPEATSKLSDFKKKTKVFESFEIDSLEKKRLFKTTYDRTLILKMSDGTKWNISNMYSEFFKELKSEKNIGKKYSFYVKTETDFYPSQVEIENKIVYNLKTSNKYNYIIIILTFILIYFCVSEIKKKMKLK